MNQQNNNDYEVYTVQMFATPLLIQHESFICHWVGSYTTRCVVRTGQKDTKKCGCLARLKIMIWSNNPEEYEIKLLHGHNKNDETIAYIPGDIKDKSRLSLSRATVSSIQQQLKDGRNCRDIRISVLHQFESLNNDTSNESNITQRKVNYDDVYNIMNKLKHELFQFHENEMILTKIWLDEHLLRDNYVIFNGNPSEYTINNNIFSFGFISPKQLLHLQSTRSICMDGTYKITTQIHDIMYTIIIRNPHTGTGYPVAQNTYSPPDLRLYVGAGETYLNHNCHKK
ncbi:hypothetical protein INT45_002565 [Circinella minor]|uniref:Uncharacterized protein n=1 Tax=Circinella minor TaxID=1195481 RepID=A0A8H7VIU6_9FUNG|nr:hypothetical protein INT45_002565 [Circinella minor]